jgi:hypothetical protein
MYRWRVGSIYGVWGVVIKKPHSNERGGCESVIKEIQSNYYHELDKLIEINKQIKEMEEENE